ncbi:hypothetical protein Daus18300_005763 [Diaporthe australafricana]|uniref:Uncharacterized protein n=1 Tax=Diaporthe australafricana TaxID=127596 RepID=A0ABR3WZM1_9PEZI
MDTYLLKAAVLFALSATQQTTTLVDEFLQNTSFANSDLDPLAYELLDLRTPLERLGDSEIVIPAKLQPPILAIVRGCGDALARVDAVLNECADGPLREALWVAKVPEVHDLKDGLQTCRRALQLALEVVNLAAAKEIGADAEAFSTYLDQDTSRVLALIRRTIQQAQEGENRDGLNLTLKKSLDDIRLYVQSLCRSQKDESRPITPLVTNMKKPLIKEHEEDASTVVISMSENTNVESPTTPPILGGGLRPAKRLSNAFGRWTLGSTRRSNAGSTLASTASSISRPSSALSSPQTPADDDDASSISSAPKTPGASRQASYTSHVSSHRSHNSFRSSISSRASRPRIISATSVPHGLYPPSPPAKNPRRTTLTSMTGSIDPLPSPPTPLDNNSFSPFKAFDAVSIANSTTSHTSDRRESEGLAPLPLFAVSPPDKIYIEPNEVPLRYQHKSPPAAIDLVRTKMLSFNEKGSGHAVTAFHVDVSPASYIVASKHGDKTIKIFGLPLSNVQASVKVNFWVSMQPRSRDFFVTSHAILSETSALVAVASGFGNSLEVWSWERRKKLQSVDAALRWAAARADIYDAKFPPLACYREAGDAIDLYPVAEENRPGTDSSSKSSSSSSGKKPFGRPVSIELCRAGLPHVPKLPELAYSATSPLLVAAAGPRPPRAGHPPPPHSAMLMTWDLDRLGGYEGGRPSSRPSRVCMPKHPELETALPCGMAAHGNLCVSIWIPNNVRVIGRPGAWQVEPVSVHSRWVLVWDMAAGGPGLGTGAAMTSVFAIPDENTIACISPDCRYVAYRQGPGADTGLGGSRNCLVILDVRAGGRELWRIPTFGGGTGLARGSEQLLDLSRVTSISFSSDGKMFFVGDVDGSVGVYEIRGGDGGNASVTQKQW